MQEDEAAHKNSNPKPKPSRTTVVVNLVLILTSEHCHLHCKSTMSTTKRTVRVAAVQAESCYFDLQAAVKKTCKLIEDAAGKGCDLIAFPEVWIPNYPGWIW